MVQAFGFDHNYCCNYAKKIKKFGVSLSVSHSHCIVLTKVLKAKNRQELKMHDFTFSNDFLCHCYHTLPTVPMLFRRVHKVTISKVIFDFTIDFC